MLKPHARKSPHPLEVFVPEAYRENVKALLVKAWEAGWSDRAVAHAVLGNEKKYTYVWSWRTGRQLCTCPRELATFLRIDLTRLLYGDVTGFAVTPAPESTGVRQYKPRARKKTVDELLAEGRARRAEQDAAKAAVQAATEGTPEWVRPK